MAKASEADIMRFGREMFSKMKGQKPGVFQKDWWSGKMMDFSMKDEAFKIEMFRFVDVFPTLRDPVQVAVHLQEYFCRPEQDFPASFQWGLGKVKPEGMIAKMAASQIEKQVMGMASKFIAGKTAEEAIPTLKKMWKKQDLAFTLDLLGEATVSEVEANEYFARYNEILDTLIAEVARFPSKPILEESPYGAVPRVNVSVKISSLYSQIDPLDFDGSLTALKDRLRPLYHKAKAAGAFINLDMEQYSYKALTLELFKSLMSEPELADYPHAGVVIQAYLRDAEADTRALCEWAKKRGTPVTVRLVKGAYWDYETIHSEQEGWPIPVFSKKWETDASYERCTEVLLDNHQHIRVAIGSHNVRSIAYAMAHAEALGMDKSGFELQMLYGMAEPMKVAAQKMGYRVRDYVPIGELVPGMAYLVRRLLENTSNESWLKASFVDGASVDELLKAPAGEPSTPEPKVKAFTEHGFRNEPMRDFSKKAHRDQFAAAVQTVRGKLGQRFDPVVNNEVVTANHAIKSLDPSHTETIVGEVGVADVALAERALDIAAAAQRAWAKRPAEERAAYLYKVAEIMRHRRDELAAWMVFEVGKVWREADADVCEAIDFCDFYAREMERLGKPRRLGRVPGELDVMFYRPRGVAAVIAPWNFPLAILCGMVMAAAVTGNTVVMKPAEQSSVIAAKFMEIVLEAGFPPGVINFLPGFGEQVGAHLVESPKTNLIAFTGSMDVGLKILQVAGHTNPLQREVKKVICEMGGKNAIIVDADADLDEAIHGVMHSAFGFQGQKCSACSRVIVHESCYEEFRNRLVAATKSMQIGPSWDPGTAVGPVIDGGSRRKIQEYVELGKQEGTLLVQREVPQGGFYVGPAIFEGITPEHRLAQEEIFGPVVALMRATDFDHAIALANSTRFALTGAVYSRSPYNIQQAYEEFDVGNLYINRGSTGALVWRQPFGGYKMSGVGTKAGGPDYLQHFMVPRSVSENTMRRGFAPED
ncbi:MAG: L-glutamate gamma-semialdehyde dehydrogenase [Myxococcota bacterium]|nr:L-glutamate gamma-semialdehyde dehydrogenase [Myxococcota bacterium]MEC9441800.1 L-glutamate gamma-semialdehyde dehydrogenase [Myxococcota bacterium]